MSMCVLYTRGAHSPVRSTAGGANANWALAGRTASTTGTRSTIANLISSPLSARFVGAAQRGIPPRSVRQLLEMRMHDEWFDQVLRVGDNLRQDNPRVLRVRIGKDVEVFFEQRVAAVRDAILLQITGPHPGRRHLQIVRFLPLGRYDNDSARRILRRPAKAVAAIPRFAAAPDRRRI